MPIIIYSPTDQALAQRLQGDLSGENPPGEDNSVIVLVSPPANTDRDVMAALEQALDENRHIVPVLAQGEALPKLIEHLEALDFRAGYDVDALRARLAAPDGEFHMRVRTSRVANANRRAGIIVAVLAVLMFAAGLYLVGVMGVQAPAREYAYVETEIILTRNYFVDQALPRTTEEAANFPATVEAARPTLRPVLIATATAVAGGD